MDDGPFGKLVVIERGPPGAARSVGSVQEAAECLLDGWPRPHGALYVAALRACHDALAGKISTETARQAFLRAAREAGILIGEAPLRGR